MSDTAREPVRAFDADRYIGTVSRIHPSSVHVTLHTTYQEDETGGVEYTCPGEVGEFVLIAAGRHALFGQIIDITSDTLPGPSENGHPTFVSISTASVQLLSSISTESNDVAPGLLSSPRIGHKVYSAAPEVVQLVVESKNRSGQDETGVLLNFAKLPNAIGTPLSFTPEMLFGRHMALLGATGGGKSWSVARLVEECARFRSKVILFDATGEYFRLGGNTRHVHIGEDPNPPAHSKEVVLPYYQLKETDLFAIFKPSGQSQAPKLRAAIKSLKLARLDPALALDGVIIKAHKAKDHYEAAYRHFYSVVESPIADFDIRKLCRQIENECVKANRSALEPNFWGDLSGIDQANCVPMVNRISDIIQSPNLGPIFNPHGKPSLLDEIDIFLADEESAVLCVSMKYLSFAHSAREIIANATGRYLLELARESRFRDQPLLIIVDEAHQFLNEKMVVDNENFPLDAFAIIAKEGRKYGLNICLATQRPRDIPEGVLSQMGTLIVHRLINDRDRAVVERASGEMDQSSLATLPALAPGEAVIVGVDFPIPISVKVERPTNPPDSRGPDYQRFWQ